ncbi:unnamed protein product, partial [Didymodactylos carnosus]
MVLLITDPDGNCLYNAVKVLMPNFETHTAEEDTVRTVNYGMWVPNHFVPLVYYYDTKSSFTSKRHPTLSKTNKLSSYVQARESKVKVCEMPAKRSRLQIDIFSGVIK